jgi:hypothetical protein
VTDRVNHQGIVGFAACRVFRSQFARLRDLQPQADCNSKAARSEANAARRVPNAVG